jgi:uncharacterized protein (DUF4213/DUF364 family)
MNCKRLFNDLIEGIAPDAVAERIICGASFSAVRSAGNIGVCRTQEEGARPPLLPKKHEGMPLRELAGCILSWNFAEASLGLAAINAWYNAPARLRGLGIEISEDRRLEDRAFDPFITLQRAVKGKNVVTVGHFPYIDKLFAPYCNLSIIERFNPQDGDYPEQAADFLLPVCDYAFISSCTLVQKSLPRMLELCPNAYVALISNSVPITPILHKYGIDALAGFAITEPELAEHVALGLGGNMHIAGHKVNCTRAQ